MSEANKEMEQLFISDTNEAIAKLEDNLLKLEQETDTEVINELFRAAHSIKGGASLLQYETLAKLAHAMENLLSMVREGTIKADQGHINALLESVDLIKQNLGTPSETFSIDDLLTRLQFKPAPTADELANMEAEIKAENSAAAASPTNDGNQNDIDALLKMAEDFQRKLGKEPVTQDVPEKIVEKKPSEPVKPAPVVQEKKNQEDSAVKKEDKTSKTVKTNETIRVNVSILNKLVNLAGELVLARDRLLRSADDNVRSVNGIQSVLQNIDLVTTEMQTEIMGMRMQPISLLFNKFPRTVRDIAQKLGKNIRLELEGETVELDKTIIEAISDPLNHLVRNSADHGIESTEERTSAGKSSESKIILRAYHQGGMVHIEVADDGRGIDVERVTRKAIEKGLITQDIANRLRSDEKVNLIFAPGFSTAEKVTGISGRGAGMDVVKTNIERIGGSVEIETVLGTGTTVKIILPLTLAIISSLIVEVAGQRFAVPQVGCEEFIRVTRDDFEKLIAVFQGGQILRLRGELLPLMHLADCVQFERKYKDPVTGEFLPERRKKYSSVNILEDGSEEKAGPDDSSPPRQGHDLESIKVLIVSTGHHRFAIIVDKIVGIEEIIVKSLPAHLRQISSYAGVTILGDGNVALIIDVAGIASKNKLVFEKTKSIHRKITHGPKSTDTMNMLIFDNSTREQLAIPVSLIKRVDKTKASDLQDIGGRKFFNYMNETTRVLVLDDYVKLTPTSPKKQTEEILIMIPKNLKIPMAMEIGKIIETKEIPVQIEDNSLRGRFILGSAIINDQITLLLDLQGIFESAENKCFRDKIESEDDKDKKKKRIVLAEDTPLYQKMAYGYLTEEGYQVFVADNGKKALDILQKESDISCVVTDIEMPIMNGYELSSAIRKDPNLKHIPIVALTSLSSDSAQQKGLKCGVTKWLLKIDKIALLGALEEILGK